MTSVFLDPALSDDERRARLYAGDLLVYSATPSSRQLVAFARQMLEEAFPGLDPEYAQFRMPVAEYAQVLARIKPAFIHDPTCKCLLPAILQELGCDPDATYFDVPRLRSSTSDGYLTTGIAFAFHAHRDTWYSAPLNQVNWWIPVFPLTWCNGMAFHPVHWWRPVSNTSADFNYQEWIRTARFNAAAQIGADNRSQPRPTEPVVLEPDLRVIPPPAGVLAFSAAQLHSSLPNTSGRTRYSIDFRTVHVGDVRAHVGAPNIDSRSTGTTMGDYLRCSDLSRLPAEATAAYDDGPPPAMRA